MLVTINGWSQKDSLGEIRYPQLRPIGFLQQHIAADPEGETSPTFIVRRARAGVVAEMSEKILINMSIGALEPPDRTPAMINAFAQFKIHKVFNLRTGQIFVPFGHEGQIPIFKVLPLERAVSTRRMNSYRIFRDVGIEVFGQKGKLNYRVAVLNGEGANQAERVDPKDLVMRLELDLTDRFALGVSGLLGKDDTIEDDQVKKNRLGAHILYGGASDKYRVIIEYSMLERGEETLHGGYVLGVITLKDQWEGLARWDYLERDGIGNSYHGLTVGSNFLCTDKVRLSLNGIGYTETSDLGELDFALTLQLQFVL
jgi:hypothetical protein